VSIGWLVRSFLPFYGSLIGALMIVICVNLWRQQFAGHVLR